MLRESERLTSAPVMRKAPRRGAKKTIIFQNWERWSEKILRWPLRYYRRR